MTKLHPQTGPITAAGKEIVSRNATTHGGTSAKLIVAGERREDFEALLNDLLAEFSPATTHARTLVEDAAMARWFLWRKQRAYNAVESALYDAQPEIERWSAETHHQHALAERYKTAAERALKRALNNLETLRRQSVQEAARRNRDRQWEAAHQLDCRRVELQEKRYQLAAEHEARRVEKKSSCLVENAVSSPRTFAVMPTEPSIGEYSPVRTAAATVTGRIPDGILEFSRDSSARR
jgi:hypothetical protein